MRPESGFRIAPNWSEIGQMTMTSQFSDMTSSSIFLTMFCFFCQFLLLVKVSCKCHHWFWSFDNLELWHAVVHWLITTAQLHSTKPELRFYADSNPARGVPEIRDGEDPWQWSRLEVRLSSVNHTTKTKQFTLVNDWPEIRKSEIPPSEFCPISGDWVELWIPNVSDVCNEILQNAAKC